LLIRRRFLTNDKIDDEFHGFGWNLSLVGVVGGTSNQLDRIIVAGMLGLEAIAAYELAYRLTDPMRNLGVFLNKLLFPRVVRVSGAKVARRFLSRIVPLIAGLIVLGVAGSLLFAPVMHWLFPRYPEAVPYAIWMFWSTLLAVVLIYLETFYIGQDRFQRTYYVAAAARSVGVIVLLPFFIHWWGVFGAIWARLLVRGGQGAAMLVKLIFDRRMLEREELADAQADDGAPRENAPCPLCGDPAGRTIARVPDRFCGGPGLFSVKRCASCGLDRQEPRVPLAAIGAYYPETYAAHSRMRAPVVGRGRTVVWRRRWLEWVTANRPGPTDIGWRRALALWPARLFALSRRLRFNPLAVPGEGRALLDLGCGSGDYLAEMAALGWRTAGLEPDPQAAELARSRGLTVVTGALPEQAGELPGPFDAIAMRMVVEHLHDPAGTLRAVRGLLAPGGVLAVQTVFRDGWWARLTGPYWFHLDQPRHLVLFTRAQLQALLRQTGWRPVAAYDFSSTTSWTRSVDYRLSEGPFGEWLGRFDNRRWAHRLAAWPLALLDLLGRGDAGVMLAVRDDAPAAGWAPRDIRDTLIQ
ncbi:MAG TPA: methyltransferase domain-containing protein, partial [bacterium]|nr:methyltransferase domain-containing protein [bacterium]